MNRSHHETPGNSGLRYLTTALDSKAMGRQFERVLLAYGGPRSPNTVTNCHVEWVKYKPGKSCLLSYRLTLRRSGERCRTQRLVARVYPTSDAAYGAYLKAKQRVLVRGEHFPSVCHVAALDMVIWSFPNERKLDGLSALCDRDALQHDGLGALVRAHWDEAWSLTDVNLELVHYAPEHTAAVRAVLSLYDSRHGVQRPWTVYGKTYWDRQGEYVYGNMSQLWCNPDRRGTALHIAKPLGYQSKSRILWQQALPGRTLLQRFPRGVYPTEQLAKMTAAIAALHQTPLTGLPSLTTADICEMLQQRCATLAAAVPEQRRCLQRLERRLLRDADTLPCFPMVTLHGDLHPQNLLVEKRQVALIDLDNLCHGPPLQDIGSWLAAIYYRGLLIGQRGFPRHAPLAFAAAYRQRVPWAVPGTAVNWYTAAALINERAFRCLSRLKAGRLKLLGELIELAEHIHRGKEDL